MKFCGEIEYRMQDKDITIHSDLCWNCDTKGQPMDPDYRAFLHEALDEWLNKSHGTGAFWVGDAKYFDNWGQ